MSFNTIPPEIRQAIWKFALPDDEPEVCIMWPLRPAGFNKTVEPLVVDTAFPVLMHVCREARDFALSPHSGIAFRHSKQAGHKVPYRRFRPEMDALYINRRNFDYTLLAMAYDWSGTDNDAAYWPALRHLAVEYSVFKKAWNWLPEFVFRYSRHVQKVSAVFPSSREAVWSYFQPPARRCKLRPVDNPDELTAAVDYDAHQEMHSIKWQVDMALVILEEYLPRKWNAEKQYREVEFHEDLMDRFEGTAWDKHSEKICLEYEIAAFAQFKRSEDGHELWEEGCEDRLLSGKDVGGRKLPLAEQHRNPEEWRVNDDDEYVP
ncbi:hypothetical protein PG994_012965 [Apiospora phragmitis]|uniref:2EXR domain-containing protein n=1 Tax=Apiospora phragmitis TaxID=2905665 RepID=A0ABR1T7B1_9PEZI